MCVQFLFRRLSRKPWKTDGGNSPILLHCREAATHPKVFYSLGLPPACSLCFFASSCFSLPLFWLDSIWVSASGTWLHKGTRESGWRLKEKGKNKQWCGGNARDPKYFIRSRCDKELRMVWVWDLLRRRANSNLWQHLTGESNPLGVRLKAQDCEGEYDSGILRTSSHLLQSIHRVSRTC